MKLRNPTNSNRYALQIRLQTDIDDVQANAKTVAEGLEKVKEQFDESIETEKKEVSPEITGVVPFPGFVKRLSSSFSRVGNFSPVEFMNPVLDGIRGEPGEQKWWLNFLSL